MSTEVFAMNVMIINFHGLDSGILTLEEQSETTLERDLRNSQTEVCA